MGTQPRRLVNNDVYDDLGERWYEAYDDPIALLRAQARLHLPWMQEELCDRFGPRACRVLDVGCGGGLVSNELARAGHAVVGVDLSGPCLDVAARHDATRSVRYLRADARSLPLPDGAFDAVCAMDFLEHVEPTGEVLSEVARVLRPRGLFFFHTFNRNLLSFVVVIKGVEWFVRNVPRDMHLLRMFIKPGELREACEARGLAIRELRGCAPRASWALARMLATGVVPRELAFRFTPRPWTGYSGFAERVG